MYSHLVLSIRDKDQHIVLPSTLMINPPEYKCSRGGKSKSRIEGIVEILRTQGLITIVIKLVFRTKQFVLY